MTFVDTSQAIEHHGIKGQKWGVRRFQNKDGSLTPAGKKRSSDGSNSKQKNKNSSVKGKNSKSASSSKKTSSSMSNDDLRKAIERMNLERQYKQLYHELNPVQVSKGKKFVDALLNKVVVPGIQEAGKTIVKKKVLELAGVQEDKKKRKKDDD